MYLKAQNDFDFVDERDCQEEADNNAEQRDEEEDDLVLQQLKAYELDQYFEY